MVRAYALYTNITALTAYCQNLRLGLCQVVRYRLRQPKRFTYSREEMRRILGIGSKKHGSKLESIPNFTRKQDVTSARVFRISTRRNSRKRELTARVTTDFLNYVIIIKFGYFYLAYPNLTLTPIQMKRNDYGHSICTCLCARSVNNFLRNNERRLKTSGVTEEDDLDDEC